MEISISNEISEEELNSPHLVIWGNPVDGLLFFGPFATYDEALLWANDNQASDKDWWLAPLTSPQTLEH
jgi:hypothetical protein